MKNRRHITPLIVIIGLVTVCLATLVYAQQWAVPQLLKNPKVVEKPGITPEQQKQLSDSWRETHKKTIKLMAELRIARLELEEALEGSRIDKSAIDKKVDEIARIKGDLLRALVAQRIAAKEILTPEQQKQLREIIAGSRADRARRLREDRLDRSRGELRREPARGVEPREMLPVPPEGLRHPWGRFYPDRGSIEPLSEQPPPQRLSRGDADAIEPPTPPSELEEQPSATLEELAVERDFDELAAPLVDESFDQPLPN
jgi:hypothetical protein